MTVALLVLPDFLLILIGWLLYHRFGFDRQFFTGLEKLIYYVLFPALLFQSILRVPISLETASDLFLATLSVLAVGVILSALAKPLLKPRAIDLASTMQCGFRFNTFIGLSLAPAVAGASGQAKMALVIGLAIPVVNFIAVYNLAHYQGKRVGLELLRNPLLISTVLGLICNFAGLTLPTTVDTLLGRLGAAAIALGVLCIGPNLNWQGLHQKTGLVLWMVVVKLMLLPIAAWLIALAFGLGQTGVQVMVLFASLPCATASYLLTVRMGGNAQLVSVLITITTLLSALTIPVWMLWVTSFS
jgi:malonate transporter